MKRHIMKLTSNNKEVIIDDIEPSKTDPVIHSAHWAESGDPLSETELDILVDEIDQCLCSQCLEMSE